MVVAVVAKGNFFAAAGAVVPNGTEAVAVAAGAVAAVEAWVEPWAFQCAVCARRG